MNYPTIPMTQKQKIQMASKIGTQTSAFFKCTNKIKLINTRKDRCYISKTLHRQASWWLTFPRSAGQFHESQSVLILLFCKWKTIHFHSERVFCWYFLYSALTYTYICIDNMYVKCIFKQESYLIKCISITFQNKTEKINVDVNV